MSRKLEAGEQFPQLELNIEDGSTVTLPIGRMDPKETLTPLQYIAQRRR